MQVEVAAEVQEGAPSQCAAVLGRLLAGLLSQAGDLLLDSLEGMAPPGRIFRCEG